MRRAPVHRTRTNTCSETWRPPVATRSVLEAEDRAHRDLACDEGGWTRDELPMRTMSRTTRRDWSPRLVHRSRRKSHRACPGIVLSRRDPNIGTAKSSSHWVDDGHSRCTYQLESTVKRYTNHVDRRSRHRRENRDGSVRSKPVETLLALCLSTRRPGEYGSVSKIV